MRNSASKRIILVKNLAHGVCPRRKWHSATQNACSGIKPRITPQKQPRAQNVAVSDSE
jgi:hypothetical protein